MTGRRQTEGEPRKEDRVKKITVNFPLEEGVYIDEQATERHTTATEIIREALWIHRLYHERILNNPHAKIVERQADGTEREIVFFTSPNQSTEKTVRG